MNIKPFERSQDQILYEQVAERLRLLITEGTLKPGDRLPSVRKLRQQLSVSTSTVLEAYRLLEDQGLITVRPQSGYYVKQTALKCSQEPAQTIPPHQACEIDTDLAFQVFFSMKTLDVVQLGVSLPAMELLPLAQLNRLMGKVLRENPILAHSYSTPMQCDALRSELAKRMLDAGCSVSPDQLTITNGAVEAVYLALQILTQPGDAVAVESPTYVGILEALRALNLRAFPLSTHPRDGVNLSDLEDALQAGSIKACLFVANFSNPLGSRMDDVNKKQLVELLNQYDLPLIEDDVYGELYFEGSRPKAFKAFDTEDRVLHCSSVSKTLSPGLRVGWCAGGRYHLEISKMKAILNLGTAIAPQLTVAAFLSNGGYDRHLRQLRRAYHAQTSRMQQAISEYFPAETRVSRPQGGHVLWLEMPAEFDALRLYHEALEHRITIAPGKMFSPAADCYGNCFRLNTALPWSPEVEKALQILGYLAKKQLAEQVLSHTTLP